MLLVLVTKVDCFFSRFGLLLFKKRSGGTYFFVASFFSEKKGGRVEDLSGGYCRHRFSSILSKKNTVIPTTEISEDKFWCIVELCSIRSDKVIKALYDYLVLKHPRSVSCNNNGVSNGYFGSCLARVEHVIQVVNELFSLCKTPENEVN